MNQKKFGKQSLWRRALALVLALSMVLIPVQFPGHIHAAEEAGSEYFQYIKDDFDTDAYSEGMLYKWKTTAGVAWADDALQLSGTSQYALVSAVSGSKDYAEDWTDYIIESELDLGAWPGTNYQHGYLAKVKSVGDDLYDCYYIRLSWDTASGNMNAGLYRNKKVKLENGSAYSGDLVVSNTVCNVPLPKNKDSGAVEGTVQVRIEVVGKTIRMFMSSKDAAEVQVFSYTDDEPLTTGTAGYAKLSPSDGGWNTKLKSFKITSADGTVLFKDDMSNRRFFDGSVLKWIDSLVTPVEQVEKKIDVVKKWAGNVGTYDADSKRMVLKKNSYPLAGSMDGTKNYAFDWEDYVVETEINFDADWTTTGVSHGILGRVTENKDGTFNAYYIRFGINGTKVTDEETKETTDTRKLTVANIFKTEKGTMTATAAGLHKTNLLGTSVSEIPISDGAVKVKVAFEGNTITVFVKSATDAQAEWKQLCSCTDNSVPLTSGTAGVYRSSDPADPANGKNLTYGCTQLGYFQITKLENGEPTDVLFNDTFANDTYFQAGEAGTHTVLAPKGLETVTYKDADVVKKWVTNGAAYVPASDWLNVGQKQYAIAGAVAGTNNTACKWTDYTVVTRINFGDWNISGAQFGILGRVKPGETAGNFDAYYIRLSLDGANTAEASTRSVTVNNVFKAKDANLASGSAPGTAITKKTSGACTVKASEEEVMVKTAFVGNTITISMAAVPDEGQEPEWQTAWVYEDETEEPLTDGTAGVLRPSPVTDASNKYGYSRVKSFKVTAADETVLFDAAAFDRTSNDTYMAGVPGKMDLTYPVNKVENAVHKWETNSGVVWDPAEGSQWMNLNGTNTYAIASVKKGEKDYAYEWTDYSVETVLDFGTWTTSNVTQGILGRVTPGTTAGKFNAYYIHFKLDTSNKIAISLVYKAVDAQMDVTASGLQGAVTKPALTAGTGASEILNTAGKARVRVDFVGNTMAVYMAEVTDETPVWQHVGTYTDSSKEPLTSGAAGVLRGSSTGATNGHGYTRVKSFKVTNLANSQTVFDTADFDGTSNDTYMAGTTKEYTQLNPDSEPSWTVTDCALEVKSEEPTVNYVTDIYKGVDYAKLWKDYAIDADIMLDSYNSYASFVACSDGANYYELRVTQNKIALYRVENGSETLCGDAILELDRNKWYFTKLEVNNGGKIIAYVDGEQKLEYELPNGAVTTGSLGLMAQGQVKFDNFAAYDVRLSDVNIYDTYTFPEEGIDSLNSNWNVGANWDVQEYKLTYITEGTEEGITSLKKKYTLENYNILANVTVPADGSVSVLGRYAEEGSYYKLELSSVNGLTLSKVVKGGEPTLLAGPVSIVDLYQQGVQVSGGSEHSLKLYMYGSRIQGYVDDVRVVNVADSEPLVKGVSAVAGTNGAAVTSVTTSVAIPLPTLAIVNGTNDQAAVIDDTNPVKAYLGKVPDMTKLYLQVTASNGEVRYVPLDTLPMTGELDGSAVTAENKTVSFDYDGQTVTLYYAIQDRTNEITALIQSINGLKAPAELSIGDAADVEALYRQFVDLSALEKASVETDAAEKLMAAREAILKLQYGDGLGEVVFADTFDTAESEKHYTNNYQLTGETDIGNWYVVNGEMMQYETNTVKQSLSYAAANMLIDPATGSYRDFKVTSVSVDVQLLETNTWAGFKFNFFNDEFYSFRITDKTNRVVLGKNSTTIKTVYTLGSGENAPDDPLKDWEGFQVGKWYNLRMTISETGLIRLYVDGHMWYEYQDKPTVANDTVLTHGAVALLTAENWTKYDNLEIRGEELTPATPETGLQPNPELNKNPGSYEDSFDDETAGSDPSHWLERTVGKRWAVKEDGENKVYASKDSLKDSTQTWLHVFDTDVVHEAKIRVDELGTFPVVALTARLTADTSYIRAGYDFTVGKWFVKTRLGRDFSEITTWSENEETFNTGNWYTLRLKVNGTTIELYAKAENGTDTLVVTADTGRKLGPGRVGFYTEKCNISIDDVKLTLTSGQGRVLDGVMEQYTAQAGAASGTLFQVIEVNEYERYDTGTKDNKGNPIYANRSTDKKVLVLNENSTQYISTDGGENWKSVSDYYANDKGIGTYYSNGFQGGSMLVLHNGHILNIQNYRSVNLSTDGGVTWEKGRCDLREFWPEDRKWIDGDDADRTGYSQPGEHLSEVYLGLDENGDPKYRIFYTLGVQQGELNKAKKDYHVTDGIIGDRTVISEVYYSDDEGKTWQMSENSPTQVSNLVTWSESHVLGITKETTDFTGRTLPVGTLVHYSTYNSSDCLRYSLSFDGGVTWEGDYAVPNIPCGWNSMTIEYDYTDNVYYMATWMNIPKAINQGFPRNRVVLLRSEDGYNWEFLCDVDRWGDVSDADGGELMQGVNMYLSVTTDHVFVSFSRSEGFSSSGSHNLQVGRLYRFEKDILNAIDFTSEDYRDGRNEYVVPDGTIVAIEAEPAINEYTLNSRLDLTDNQIKVYYYDGTTDLVDMADAFVHADLTALGQTNVTVDYKHFRTVYSVNVIAGDAPVISGVEDGKTYCLSAEVSVSDTNNDLKEVTVNGRTVTLTDGKFTLAAAEDVQTIVATDNAGNSTTLTVTVNEAHTPETDDNNCTTEVRCSVCQVVTTPAESDHSYTYSAQDNVITESCGNAGCTAHSATATITAPAGTLIYDGTTEFKAEVTYGSSWTGAKPEISYNRSELKGAGSYEASVTVGGETAKVSYTVAKAQVTAPAADATVFTYTGNAQTYTLAESVYYTVANNVQTNADTYKVTVTLKDTVNYEWSDGTVAAKEYDFVISKQTVQEPTVGSAVYTGQNQTANVADTALYKVQTNKGGMDVGQYDVVLQLKDANNYQWSTTNEAVVTLKFSIVSTANTWTTTPAVADSDYGVAPNPVGAAQFGQVVFTWYDSQKQQLQEAPTTTGSYYMKAGVAADGSNYGALTTDFIAFQIKACTHPTTSHLQANNNGTHDVICDQCSGVIEDDVTCTSVTVYADCTREETCACGNVTKAAAASHTLSIKEDKDATDHTMECTIAGCDHEEAAKHVFDQQIQSQTYWKNDADCETAKTYYKSCLCGHKGTDTFTAGEKQGHDYSVWVNTDADEHWKKCSRCDAIDEATRAEHVYKNYATNNDDTHTGKCECGKPHTADCSGGTATCKELAKCEVCNKEYGELAAHKPAADDGDCTTAIKCTVCDEVTTAAKASHTGGTATCKDKAECSVCGTAYGDLAEHKPAADDGDCTTAIKCTVCDEVTTAAKASHTGGTATCKDKAECTVCGKEYGELAAHKPAADDGDCTTAIKCTVCDEVTTAAKASHTGGTATCKDKAECSVCGTAYGDLAEHKPAADDGDCTTAIKCTVCGKETTAAKTSHTGGTATCKDKAECSVCGKEYGGLDADNHTGEAQWSYTSTSHTKIYECCGAAAVAEADHKLVKDKCECGYIYIAPGKIENITDKEENAAGGELDVKDEHLADKLLTPEEKEVVSRGEEIKVELTVEDVTAELPREEQKLIEEVLGDKTAAMHLDINLIKQVGDKEASKITETKGAVTITIIVPQIHRNTDSKIIRTYSVIRIHNGKTDMLPARFDEVTGELKFDTDRFSTYTLVYSDAPADSGNTGDDTAIVLLGSLLVLSAVAMGVLLIPNIRKKWMK